jgi:2-succinyl-6-hydroxy-2,4-cyclohexadiene-1-carboxylate synthase
MRSVDVVLLHGFASSRRSWARVEEQLDSESYRSMALDLRGHGSARDMRPISFDACVGDIAAAAPARFTLCGYSLGGRVALHAALALGPERIERLVLVSASAGIEDEGARTQRREADERLAAMLDEGRLEEMVTRWRALPLFAADPEWVAEEVAQEQRRNDPQALAAVFRGLGAGVMTPLWGRLGELGMDLRVIVGERDTPYVALAQRYGPYASQVQVIPGAGHRLPLENPAAVVAACVS